MIESEPRILDDDLRQGGGIAQAEIESEPGDRVDHMRRIADQRQPLADEAVGDEQVERKALQPADDRHIAQPLAHPHFERALLLARIGRQDLGCARRRFRPHDRAAIAGERQDRERAGR